MVKTTELTHLVSTWTSSLVEVESADGSISLGSFQLDHPTVAEALSVYALLPSASGGNTDDAAALYRVVMNWLPLRLATALFTRKQSWTKRAELLMALLTVGLSDQEVAEQQLRDVEEKAGERSWTSVLAEYASVYHADPLSEPWAYFLERCAVLDEVRARTEVSMLTWYAAAKAGKADPLFVRAGMKDGPREVEDPAFMSDPDWKAEQLRKIQQLRQKQGRA